MFASKWFRRVEIAFWVLGMCLLGAASGATVVRWNYQRQQERALFSRGPAVPVTPLQRAAAGAQKPDVSAPLVTPASPNDLHADRSGDAGATRLATPVRRRATAEIRPPDADPAAVGRIEIPRLGVAAIVSEGADEDTLERAVGLVPGSAHPGDAGNVVLAGHRDTFFSPLRDIQLNDRIRIVLPSHTYEYKVQSMRVVEPDETSVLASKGVEELTLVTCYPFRYIGSAPERFIVKATPVN